MIVIYDSSTVWLSMFQNKCSEHLLCALQILAFVCWEMRMGQLCKLGGDLEQCLAPTDLRWAFVVHRSGKEDPPPHRSWFSTNITPQVKEHCCVSRSLMEQNRIVRITSKSISLPKDFNCISISNNLTRSSLQWITNKTRNKYGNRLSQQPAFLLE